MRLLMHGLMVFWVVYKGFDWKGLYRISTVIEGMNPVQKIRNIITTIFSYKVQRDYSDDKLHELAREMQPLVEKFPWEDKDELVRMLEEKANLTDHGLIKKEIKNLMLILRYARTLIDKKYHREINLKLHELKELQHFNDEIAEEIDEIIVIVQTDTNRPKFLKRLKVIDEKQIILSNKLQMIEDGIRNEIVKF